MHHAQDKMHNLVVRTLQQQDVEQYLRFHDIVHILLVVYVTRTVQTIYVMTSSTSLHARTRTCKTN